VLGLNALAVFFLSTLVARFLIAIQVSGAGGQPRALHAVLYDALFAPWAAPPLASFAWALANVLLWLLAMWPLARRNIRLGV
jgi:predicted acyltransferase